MDSFKMNKSGKEKHKEKTAPKGKKEIREKQPKTPRPGKEPKEGKKSSSPVLLVIILIALLGAGGAIAFTFLSAGSSSGSSDLTASLKTPGHKTAQDSAAQPGTRTVTPPMAASIKPDVAAEQQQPEQPADEPPKRAEAARAPIVPSAPPVKETKKPTEEELAKAPLITETDIPGNMEKQPQEFSRHPAARTPIIVSSPPPKPMRAEAKTLPIHQPAAHSPSTSKPAAAKKPAQPAVATKQGPAPRVSPVYDNAKPSKTENITVTSGAKQPARVASSFYDVSPETFPRKTTMDDFYGWPGGQSYGTSKTMLKGGDPKTWQTSNETEAPSFKRGETLYMVLVRESASLNELRAIAEKLNMNSPKPEIKQTTSFGREIYWLTVGHYTTESKAYNKAQEIIERGYPATIVSEKVNY